MFSAKIIADSISSAGHRITTVEATFPRFILAELNTHRTFSRNSASSRAIPVEKNVERSEEDPFVPLAFTKNQRGMQATDVVEEALQKKAKKWWLRAHSMCVGAAEVLCGFGVHKQHANRLLETWGWHTAIFTATEWENFWALRCDPNAQPEAQEIACLMKKVYEESDPHRLVRGEWHLPYVDRSDEVDLSNLKKWARISAARCARVSTLTMDGVRDVVADLSLYEKLVGPGHMSPLEHPCRPMTEKELARFRQPNVVWDEEIDDWYHLGGYTHFLGNVQGWVQLRKMIPNESNFGKIKAGRV
jgi:hypothetical protein